jgi:hypothetical protein
MDMSMYFFVLIATSAPFVFNLAHLLINRLH